MWLLNLMYKHYLHDCSFHSDFYSEVKAICLYEDIFLWMTEASGVLRLVKGS